MILVNIIGIMGGILGISLYFPQIIRSFKTKSTHDLSLWTYLLIFANDILWSGYGVGINNPIIYGPNIISVFLCVTILLQKRRFG